MRFLPQDDDSGGFFVAVFERPPQRRNADDDEHPVESTLKREKTKMPEDMEFVELQDVYDVEKLIDFYGLTTDFPRGHLLTRKNDEGSKKVMLVSGFAKDLILANRLRVVHAGVVVFQRTTQSKDLVTVPFRLAQDGIDVLLPFVTKRNIPCDPDDMTLFLNGGSISFPDLSPGLVDNLRGLAVGSIVLSCRGIPLVCWRGDGDFIIVYCAKPDLVLLKSRLASILASSSSSSEPSSSLLLPPDPDPDDDVDDHVDLLVPDT